MSTSTLPVVTRSPDLISQLLHEQQSLTAVEQFSALHEQGLHDPSAVPLQSKYYRSLLPASPPASGQQYAFEVDLDQCSGCKACVVACHTLNGLDEDESWRRVGTLTIGGDEPAIQHVTTACHHCEDPGCLNGCPVKAYEKDADTGIVRHLDDQCIGCKYCTMMCPYEVPQYSDRLGIVRKCDMCHQRLAVGEAPACVQSCPNEAIKITTVSSEMAPSGNSRLAPGAPVSRLTKPTTRYLSEQTIAYAESTPQDIGIDHVAESHWPLAVMLVATEVSVGMLVVERAVAIVFSGTESPELTRWTALVSLLVGMVGLNIAALHLGQPLRAWRVFLGLRTSWLSREAIVLGKFVGLLSIATGLLWMPVFADRIPATITDLIPQWAGAALLSLSAVVGVAGLMTSAMIYIVTRRHLWRPTRTLLRFYGTAAVVGIAAVASLGGMTDGGKFTTVSLFWIAAAAAGGKIAWEWSIQLNPRGQGDSYDRRSRKLVAAHLEPIAKIRLATGIVGAVLLAVAGVTVFASPTLAGCVGTIAVAAIFLGELAERWLYFSSVVHDRMPGTM
tara:strand:+ start:481325 stop:483001 length:1677 start_codon:yes stop_codon:yes gene_type:complete